MAEAEFPGQHTTTTTVTTSTTVQTNLRYDPSYIKTIPGLLKCVQITLNLLGFICIECSSFRWSSRGEWFNTVAMTGLWFTGIMLAFYLFHVVEKFFRIPWLKIEFIFCGIWVLFYFIASILAVTYGVEAFIVAGFFGFLAMVAYGYDAWIKYLAIQNGELAQGQRAVAKQTTTMTSPAY